MPSRLIRDDMLDSERVQTLPIEARWLYVTILLTADDVGLFEVNNFKLGRRAGLDNNKLTVLVQLLADSDLIRVYEVEGKRFGFIPRFRQRLQIKRTKHPVPPAELMADDVDASNKINDLASKARLGIGEPRLSTVVQPSEPEPEPEVEIKDLAPTVLVKRVALDPTIYRVPDCPYERLFNVYHEALPMLGRVVVISPARKATLRSRWTEVCAAEKYSVDEGVQWFRDFLWGVRKSKFLTGNGAPGKNRERPFKADFDWLMTPKYFARVVEGRYHEETQ